MDMRDVKIEIWSTAAVHPSGSVRVTHQPTGLTATVDWEEGGSFNAKQQAIEQLDYLVLKNNEAEK